MEIAETTGRLVDSSRVDAGWIALTAEEPGSFLDLKGVRAVENLDHLNTGRSRKLRRQGKTPPSRYATRL